MTTRLRRHVPGLLRRHVFVGLRLVGAHLLGRSRNGIRLAAVLLWAVVPCIGTAAEEPKAELCALKTVAVVGDEGAVKAVKKRVAKDTWLKRLDDAQQADAVLEVRMRITSFSFTTSGNRAGSATREGTFSATLRRRGSEQVVWRGQRRLDSSPTIVESLLKQLGSDAGCQRR